VLEFDLTVSGLSKESKLFCESSEERFANCEIICPANLTLMMMKLLTPATLRVTFLTAVRASSPLAMPFIRGISEPFLPHYGFFLHWAKHYQSIQPNL